MSQFVENRGAPGLGRRALLVGTATGAAGLAAGLALGANRAGAASLPDGLEAVAVPTRVRDHHVAFDSRVRDIYDTHWAQTSADVAALREKYRQPVFGTVDPTELVDELARCIDPADNALGNSSQHVHLQQILVGMEADGVTDEDMYLAAMTHDLGKVLLLTDEDPANVVCTNRPIGEHTAGVGLDNVVFQWNHDEFIWERMGELVPDHVAWLMRYHSIEIGPSRPYMDDRDLEYLERWLVPFRRYDFGTKSTHSFDPGAVDRWKPLMRDRLPRSIVV